jgi:hypothetical protein
MLKRANCKICLAHHAGSRTLLNPNNTTLDYVLLHPWPHYSPVTLSALLKERMIPILPAVVGDTKGGISTDLVVQIIV